MRVKLKFPDQVHFETEMPIRITDVNYGGHLSNDKVLSLIHEARYRFYQHFGYSEMDIEGLATIMADAAIRFQHQGNAGDQLVVRMAIDNWTRVGFDLFYQLQKIDGPVIATAKTYIVLFDYTANSVQSVPEKFIEKFQ